MDHKAESFPKGHASEQFVFTKLERRIKEYEVQKAEFEEEFKRLAKKDKATRNLKSICGIGNIHGVQIAAIVVDARRFPKIGNFLSYCGLVKHKKISGGKSYGMRA